MTFMLLLGLIVVLYWGKHSLLPSLNLSFFSFRMCQIWYVQSKDGFSYPAKCQFDKSICIFTVSEKLFQIIIWLWGLHHCYTVQRRCAVNCSCSIVTCGNARVQNQCMWFLMQPLLLLKFPAATVPWSYCCRKEVCPMNQLLAVLILHAHEDISLNISRPN